MEFVCDNVTILEAWKVAWSQFDGICCRKMLAGGTAEVQERYPCTLTI